MQQNKPADFSCANLDGLFGILHTRKVLVHAARSDFRAYFAWSSGVIWCWSRFGIACLRVAAVNLVSDTLQKPSC
jgi:hypothetical protein